MTAWLGPDSTETDWRIERAWSATNQVAQHAGIPHSVMHRLTVCVGDLLAVASLLRENLALKLARARAEFSRVSLTDAERVAHWRSFSSQLLLDDRRLSVLIKALYLLVRSFLDAAYAVLLHAIGSRSGRFTSLNRGLATPKSDLYQRLEQELPGFVAWFGDARELRNQMKMGLGTHHGACLSNGVISLEVNVQSVKDEPREVDIARKLTEADLELALTRCADFMEFVSQGLSLGELPGKPSAGSGSG